MTEQPTDEQDGGPLRPRLTVPLADVSVVEWIEAQENLSVSFRLLVRDWIRRNGMTDPACHPVAQLPRRGRPPRDLGAASVLAHQQRQVEIDVGMAEGALRVDRWGEAVCTSCGAEHPHHEAGCERAPDDLDFDEEAAAAAEPDLVTDLARHINDH